MTRKPRFENFDLSKIRDKHGKSVNVGDSIRFMLYDGVENLIMKIEQDEHGYYKPYILPHLEFELVKGELTEDDVPYEEYLLWIVDSKKG